MAADAKAERGWGWPLNSRKAHYFDGGRALCGGWLFMGEVSDTMHDSPDNCGTCKRMRAAEEKRAAKLAEKEAKAS